LGEVAAVFFRLGCTAFGGPAAHIAMMRHELVERRRWVSDAQFLDLLAAANLIPGPNSTELAIHLGYRRAGWAGLVVAGSLFIGPAMVIVLAIAWAYATYGSLPEAQWLLYGIKPVIIAIVLQALYGLARTALKGPVLIAVAAGVLALYLAGVNELALLFGGGLLALVAQLALRRRGASEPRPAAPAANAGQTGQADQGEEPGDASAPAAGPTGAAASPDQQGAPPSTQNAPVIAPLWTTSGAAITGAAGAAAMAVPFSLPTLFLTFLKIGAVLYGSGYVLLAFLRGDFVERLGWLTDQQLLDAISVGQFTPGPVFTTATFVGYLIGSASGATVSAGVAGALVATLGIFLPSFIFVALSGPLVPHLRRWTYTALLLDGVNAAALGLMAAVMLTLARAAIVDPLTVAIALAALLVLLRWKVNSAWLVLGGGLVGLAAQLLFLR
jgi:chromate transporter